MSKILILIGSHLSTAPRPLKEALTFLAEGHQVIVSGTWYDDELVKQDEVIASKTGILIEPALDFRRLKVLSNIKARTERKLASVLYRTTGLCFPALYGYGANKLFSKALFINADLTIVHSEAAMYAGIKLLGSGRRVGVDMEDWFSKDLLPEARANRPITMLTEFEKVLLKECTYKLTTSNAMADAIASEYSVSKPAVIYNTFHLADRDDLDNKTLDRRDRNKLSLHWYSHSVGPGRGLETLFKALLKVEVPLELHIRGHYPDSAKKIFDPMISALKNRSVFFHDRVPPNELLSRIAEHDVGLALEPSDVKSTDLTVSNKLLQSILAGVAVIATDTTGQREVMSEWCSSEQLVSVSDVDELANTITMYATDRDTLAERKSRSLKIAEHKLNFEYQSATLITLLEKALG